MKRKIFVSYKHGDRDVNGNNNTARDYVDHLIDKVLDDEIYKGEGDEDLSEFKDETIETHLKDKVYDSSVTLVLISPNMKDDSDENNQWIPWEISYSLKEVTRNGRTSESNAILAVILPDSNDSYEYFIEENICNYCNARRLKTDTLFSILKNNMFNRKQKEYSGCHHHSGKVYSGESSYIISVKWSDFISDKDKYINRSITLKDKKEEYNIQKVVKNEQ